MVNIPKNIDGIVGKIKQAAQQNPEKVRDGLAKVESLVDSKTGGKYREQMAKGSEMLTKTLGIPGRHGRSTGPVAEHDIPETPTAPPPRAPKTGF